LVVLCGSTVSNGTRYVNYFLDVNGGMDGNGVNIQLYNWNGTNAQRYAISSTNQSTYVLRTKVSNYGKAVTVQNAGCANGNNVYQWQYYDSNHDEWTNDEWIIEPIFKNATLGVAYARANWQQYVPAYPNFGPAGADCTNFVSQCMLASGIHYKDDWRVYRKNSIYSTPANDPLQINYTWELCQPRTSPWISAAEFGKYWKSKLPSQYWYATGQYIVDHPDSVWALNIYNGDVVQYAPYGLLGVVGSSEHTMYITGYLSTTNYTTYKLTYHSNPAVDVSLIDICKKYPDKYFIFYHVM